MLGSKTDGGEALTVSPDSSSDTHWYAVWTRSHSEQLVADQLLGKGFSVFLPKVSVWSRRGGKRHVITIPMFSSYLFLRDAVDKTKYIEVHKARGVVSILGERWDRLSEIPYGEISSLQQAVDAQLPIMPHPFLKKGQRVRITGGSLKGVEGFLVDDKADKGLLVLSVELLQRSVAVQIDCTRVVPA
jgi:transcription antitermination factor NusG